MRGDDTSASLRKSHLLMLARCWGYRSELWARKEGRKRVPLQAEPMPAPLGPRRADARAAAQTARAAADEARLSAAFAPQQALAQAPAGYLLPCVATAIAAALADTSSGAGQGAPSPRCPGEAAVRYSCASMTTADGVASAGAGGRSSTTAVKGGEAVTWLHGADVAAEAAWRQPAAAHAAAAAGLALPLADVADALTLASAIEHGGDDPMTWAY